jgi:starch synthase/alpha-amylase
MLTPSHLPRILFATPDAIFFYDTKAADDKLHSVGKGKKVDLFAGLLKELYHFGFDLHMVQPEYRKLFSFFAALGNNSDCSDIPRNRLHLVRDRIFYYSDDIDVNRDGENIKISIALQREIIHHMIPMLQPDLIHCHDWMTGLIPAAARRLGIPCLFTVYDIHSKQIPLCRIEEMGVDAADCVSTASLGFASEVSISQNIDNKTALRKLLTEKCQRGCISCNYQEALDTSEYIDLYRALLN